MATSVEFPQSGLFELSVNNHAQPQPFPKEAKGPSRPINSDSAVGWAQPFLYAVVGISLGVLTGLAVSVTTMPIGASIHSSNTIQASSSVVDNGILPSAKPDTRGDLTPAVVVSPVTSMTHPATAVAHQGANHKASNVSRTNLPVHQGAKSVTAPVSAIQASVQPPDSLSNGRLNPSRGVSQSNFYVAGIVKVVDYDAHAGTIQTDDGRTLLIGATTAMSSGAAQSIEAFGSNVHYRCGQDGSCTINGGGMTPVSARFVSHIQSI